MTMAVDAVKLLSRRRDPVNIRLQMTDEVVSVFGKEAFIYSLFSLVIPL